jgi:hypothetical protein
LSWSWKRRRKNEKACKWTLQCHHDKGSTDTEHAGPLFRGRDSFSGLFSRRTLIISGLASTALTRRTKQTQTRDDLMSFSTMINYFRREKKLDPVSQNVSKRSELGQGNILNV